MSYTTWTPPRHLDHGSPAQALLNHWYELSAEMPRQPTNRTARQRLGDRMRQLADQAERTLPPSRPDAYWPERRDWLGLIDNVRRDADDVAAGTPVESLILRAGSFDDYQLEETYDWDTSAHGDADREALDEVRSILDQVRDEVYDVPSQGR